MFHDCCQKQKSMVYVPSHQHNFFVERIFKKRNCNFKIASKVGLLTLIWQRRAILKQRERKNKNIQHQQKQQIILIRLFNLLLFQLVNSTIVLFLDSNPMKLSYFFENGKKDKRCLLSNIHDGIKIQKRKLEYTRERGGKSYSEDTSHLFVLY